MNALQKKFFERFWDWHAIYGEHNRQKETISAINKDIPKEIQHLIIAEDHETATFKYRELLWLTEDWRDSLNPPKDSSEEWVRVLKLGASK